MKNMFTKIKKIIKNKQFTWIVTGSSGFIGSSIVNVLLSLNQNVIGLDKNIEKIKIKNKNFKFIKIDLTNFNNKSLIKNKIDYILHQASLVSVQDSFLFPDKYLSDNFLMFKNILDLAKKKRVKSLVFASSCSVYGKSDRINKEDDSKQISSTPHIELSPYAFSKHICEQYAIISKVSFPVVGLRYFNVFGINQKIKGLNLPVISKWIETIKAEKPIEIFGKGNASRNFVYVDDVIYANILAALKIKKKMLLNVCSNRSVTLKWLSYLFIKLCTKYVNHKIRVKFVKKNFNDLEISKGSNSKIKKILNFKFSDRFNNNLIKTFNWQFKNKI